MKLLITGICGFVGSTLARAMKEHIQDLEVIGLDNLIRPGSERNREQLLGEGIPVFHADIRNRSDLESLPPVDWVIDAAANPSVTAGVDGKTSSRQLVEHNLFGTVNLLEFCKSSRAGFILLSTSRVYSIKPLINLEYEAKNQILWPKEEQVFPEGVSPLGLAETFSNEAPLSLYGATKFTSESLALEYGSTFDLPVWINRCGVLAGAGQFGRPDQGIFSYWIHSYREKAPLKYIGFDGRGYQSRDCLHPRDIAPLIRTQINSSTQTENRIFNVSGGAVNAMSLRNLSDWCADRFPVREIASDPQPRAFDIPWMVLDNHLVEQEFGWKPLTPLESILSEIAGHADTHPNWLAVSRA